MEFLASKHKAYLEQILKKKDLLAFANSISDHQNMSGAYWSLAATFLLKVKIPEEDRRSLSDFVICCQNPDGGFGGSKGHDSCVTHTLYALIILMLLGDLEKINKKKVGEFIHSMYQPDQGAFKGDSYGEVDARFCFSALYALRVLGEPLPEGCAGYFEQCKNFDGGFGGRPEAESHAAYTYCVVGGLAIMGRLDLIDRPLLARFLAMRQTVHGGFNGRPEKLPDVCYSWWVLSSVAGMEETIDLIDTAKLERYILECQDPEEGGFSDRPGNGNDVFHTFFAIAGLSLIDAAKYNLDLVDPVFAIPKSVRQKYIL
jgi:geranylgeranyl transferase type-2 subunit beta